MNDDVAPFKFVLVFLLFVVRIFHSKQTTKEKIGRQSVVHRNQKKNPHQISL